MKKLITLSLVISISILSCGFKSEKVDLILHNAKIYTVDAGFQIFEAVAVKDGKIVDIGAERTILNKYSAAKTLDLGKKTVVPGIIDAHSHFCENGFSSLRVDLSGTKSWNECLERLQAFAKNSDKLWITGGGWDHNDWEVKTYPNNEELNKLFPDRAVYLKRIDWHAAIANAKALELAAIDDKTIISGGEILKDAQGQLTGILIDNGMLAIDDALPAPTEDDIKKAILASQKECFAEGLTSVVDAGLPLSTVHILDELHQSNALKMRVYAMLNPDEESLEQMKIGPIKTDFLNARSIKMFGDGSLGSRGAFLKEPYSDHENHFGAMIHDVSEYKKWAEYCNKYDFQLNTHSIGDATSAALFNVFKDLLKFGNDKRWRIEHAQIVSPSDRHFFRDLGLIPSIQPTHATSDMYWAEERLGEKRMEGAYAYKSLLKENGFVALGTDFPVEKISPIATFHAAVARKDSKNYPKDGFQKEEALTRREALMGMTIWAALASFEEHEKGSLEVGKFADFTVLDRDILEISEEMILNTQVTHTIVGGEVVFQQ